MFKWSDWPQHCLYITTTVSVFKWSDWPKHYITATVQYQYLSGLTPTLYHHYSTVPMFKWSDWPQHYITTTVQYQYLSGLTPALYHHCSTVPMFKWSDRPQHYITTAVQYQCSSGLTDPSTISPLQYSTNVQVVWQTPALYHRCSTVPMFKWSDWPQHYITATVQYQCLSGLTDPSTISPLQYSTNVQVVWLTPALYHRYSTVPVFKWSDWPQHYITTTVQYQCFKWSDWPQHYITTTVQYQCLSGLTDPSTISPLQYSTNVQVVWLTPALYHRYSTVPMFKWSDRPQHYITTTVQYQCSSGLTDPSTISPLQYSTNV